MTAPSFPIPLIVYQIAKDTNFGKALGDWEALSVPSGGTKFVMAVNCGKIWAKSA